MATEINKEKELEVGTVKLVVGKADADDTAAIKEAFGKIVGAIKTLHIG